MPMKQLTLVGPNRLEWREVPEPTLHGGFDALVRPLAVATCDLDTCIVHGMRPFPPPLALGHEFVAEVMSVGDQVSRVRPGTRVAVAFQVSCGTCDRCQAGHTAHCRRVPPVSQFGFGAARGEWGGALSDLVRIPFADAMCVDLPPGMDPRPVASLSDNLPDAWRCVVPPLRARPGAPVMVVGGQWDAIGLYAMDIARASGAAECVLVDSDPRRLALAEAMGARALEAPEPGMRFPVVVDCSGTPEGLLTALRATEPEGICTSASIFWEGAVAFPMLELYRNGVTFRTGRVNARACMEPVLAMVVSGAIDPGRFTHALVPWADASEALSHHRYKTVVWRQ